MKRLLLLPVLALAACTEAGAPMMGRAEPPAAQPLPPQVLAALPTGVPSSVVTRNTDGCYLLTVEQTDPPSGFPLRDAAGNPVCEAGAALAAPAALPNPA